MLPDSGRNLLNKKEAPPSTIKESSESSQTIDDQDSDKGKKWGTLMRALTIQKGERVEKKVVIFVKRKRVERFVVIYD